MGPNRTILADIICFLKLVLTTMIEATPTYPQIPFYPLSGIAGAKRWT
jgi:hypothetical protein